MKVAIDTNIFNQASIKLQDVGYTFFTHSEYAAIANSNLDAGDANWQSFVNTWEDLSTDTYMADGGKYRLRRYATLAFNSHTLEYTVEPEQPHYQSLNYNPLNGGVARYFSPILVSTLQHYYFQLILHTTGQLLRTTIPTVNSWRIEAHQFRIIADNTMIGLPTPEGIHQDGVDFVAIVLIQRRNITPQSGISKIFTLQRELLVETPLIHPLDTVFLNDPLVYHGVTPIYAQNQSQQGLRDVLVLTCKRILN